MERIIDLNSSDCKKFNIDFAVIVYDGESYTRENPGIALADYADLLDWNDERNEDFWDKVMGHYMDRSKFSFECICDDKTSIENLEKIIVKRLGFNWEMFKNAYVYTYMSLGNELVRLVNRKLDIKALSKHYEIVDKLQIYFVFSNQAGEIWNDNGLRYYMHSKESGKHNNPHIHVDYKHECSVSICLYDGSVLDGSIPSKMLRIAKKRILENKKFLLECWNKMTDGIKVDINHYFGIIPFDCGK